MRLPDRVSWIALALTAGVVAAIPAIGQDRPESILPPGFGDTPESAPARRPDSDAAKPKPGSEAPTATTAAPSAATPSDIPTDSTQTADATDETANDAETPVLLVDIPPQARRSTGVVGLLGATDGDMGHAAFANVRGQYLAKVMRHLNAPIASRWASIVLRRALLSKAETPSDVNGADWAAERAWLLVRMGEATSARSLVQAVDVDQYTPDLYTFGMQAALASADPAALCPMTEGADRTNRETSWTLARAICSAFSGESSLASAQLDRARSRRGDTNADVLLAEKVVGAASNTRRAVTINWDEIRHIDTWRYGMATSTGLEIPERLLQSVDPRVRAWRAQAPLLSYTSRLPDADRAAAMGILSSAALVDFYGAANDETDPAEQGNKLFDLLRDSYAADGDDNRVDALGSVWSFESLGEWQKYARSIVTARAAARIAPSEDFADQAAQIISSMLSAGLDTQAMRWSGIVRDKDLDEAWGLLAVASPRATGTVSESQIKDFGSASAQDGELRARMLFAGLAGLGRVPNGELQSMAESFSVPIGRQTKWSAALDEAVRLRSPGTVAVLCAVGLQARRWSDVPPDHLYRVVSALRHVGLEAEARMIAAEAISRA